MPEQLANRNDNNLEMKKQQPQHNNQQKQTTREQKAKQRLANRAKRNAANQNLKTKIINKSSSPIPKSKNSQAKSQQSSPYSDQQNVSLPEITTKISGTEKTNNNNKICVRYDQNHHASRHASPGASSITGI